jgi:NTE family protein
VPAGLTLVVGSGGLQCVAAIGLLRVLAEAGIAGGARGRLLGRFALRGGRGARVRRRARGGVHALVLDARPDAGLRDEPQGGPRAAARVRRPRRVRRRRRRSTPSLAGAFGDLTFADARMPLAIVATDLESGAPVVLREGLVRDAVRASAAIPVVFPPKSATVGCSSTARSPTRCRWTWRSATAPGTIVAMAFDLPYRTRLKSLAAVQEQVTAITTNHLLRARFAFQTLAHHGEIVPIVPTFDRAVSMFDPSTIPYLIERGEAAARAHLPFLEAALGA